MNTKIIASLVLLAAVAVGFVLMNRDGGTPSSEPLTAVSEITHAHGLGINVADSSKLYIATHHGLLLFQDDSNLYRVGNSEDDLMGFSLHPTNPDIFLSSGHPSRGGNIGFQRSDDAGLTWNKVSEGVGGPVDFHAMAVSPVNPDLIYGFYGRNLQRSTDGGRSWELTKGVVLSLSLVADFAEENALYAATQNGVQVSKDRGDTWMPLSKDLEQGVVTVYAPHPKDRSYALAFAERIGGLGVSIDGGKTWAKSKETFNGEAILHIAYGRQTPDIVYALTNKNAVYKSIDKGGSWAKIR